MTTGSYYRLFTLAEHFYLLSVSGLSDIAAIEQLERLIRSGELICDPPLPTTPYRLLLLREGGLVIETNDALLDAAAFQVMRRVDDTPSVRAASSMLPSAFESAHDDKPLPPQADNKPARPRGKGLTRVWRGTIEPQIELAIQKRGGPYAALENAVDAVFALPAFEKSKRLGKKPPLGKRAVRDGIRSHFKKWFVPEGKKDV